MSEEKVLPIIVNAPIFVNNKCIRFLAIEDNVEIKSDNVDQLWKILGECNGRMSIEDIAHKTGIDYTIVLDVIKRLMAANVLLDSRKQYLHFHEISNYPTPYLCSLTKKEIEEYRQKRKCMYKVGEEFEYKRLETCLEKILDKRRSCRLYRKKPLDLNTLGNICSYGYAIFKHRVPSGGALYPLRIYVVAERNQVDFPCGYYEYDYENEKLIRFNADVDEEALKHCFNMEDIGFGSPIQIVIVGDLGRQTLKYGNRGYRLTLIEAGHVAQNICLFCTEQGLDTCELGGMIDYALKAELELPEENYPLLGIAIGYRDDSDGNGNSMDEIRFVEENISSLLLKPNSYGVVNYIDKGSFFAAVASYGEEDYQRAGATSASSEHAIFKAVIEAHERKVSGMAQIDFLGSAKELEQSGRVWLDPRDIIPLTKEQSDKCGLTVFHENLDIPWTRGVYCKDKAEIYIPTDLVYYGHFSEKNQIYIGNSSGVAAHIDYQEAGRSALTELIERDAIMRCWFSQRTPGRLDNSILPIHIRKRIHQLKVKGRETYFLELPSEYAEVILAVIVGDDYPCFVCGASATLSDEKDAVEETMLKALREAEYGLYSSIRFSATAKKPDLQKIFTPEDHGNLYHYASYATHIKWLWQGESQKKLNFRKKNRYDELAKELDAIVVDISYKDAPVYVLRMLSPKLVPINFGYDNAHYTHIGLKGIFNPESLQLPHFFA